MQDFPYYVLGRKDSPVLEKYFELYKTSLQKKYIQLCKKEILEFHDGIELLHPEISSLLHAIDSGYERHKNTDILNSNFLSPLGGKRCERQRGNTLGVYPKGDRGLIPGTDIQLTSDDLNPYNRFEAHPEHIAGGAIAGNWGERNQQEWRQVFTKAFEILKKSDRGTYDELNSIIKKIIPLGTSREVHNSASYGECIGHLYLGYTIDASDPEISIIEALIHESSHNKLNLVMQSKILTLNDMQEKYYSPYRPDARHIHGIFLGVHAIVATTYIMLKAYRKGHILDRDGIWCEKILLSHLKNKIGLKVLEKHAHLTNIGEIVLSQMKHVSTLSDELISQLPLTADIISSVKYKNKQHFLQVNRDYSNLEY